MQVGFGNGGFNRFICAHRGFVCWESRFSRSSFPASSLERGIWVEVIEVVDGAIIVTRYCGRGYV
jgi:hypothetical protein